MTSYRAYADGIVTKYVGSPPTITIFANMRTAQKYDTLDDATLRGKGRTHRAPTTRANAAGTLLDAPAQFGTALVEWIGELARVNGLDRLAAAGVRHSTGYRSLWATTLRPEYGSR